VSVSVGKIVTCCRRHCLENSNWFYLLHISIKFHKIEIEKEKSPLWRRRQFLIRFVLERRTGGGEIKEKYYQRKEKQKKRDHKRKEGEKKGQGE